MRWSACGRLLASGSDDRSLRLWSIPQATQAAAVPINSSMTCLAGTTSQAVGAAQVAVGTQRGATVELQPLRTLWGHGGRLWDCCFGSGGWAGSSSVGTDDSDAGCGSSASWTGGLGSFLVTASEDCTCRVWCLATGRQLAAVQVRLTSQEVGTSSR